MACPDISRAAGLPQLPDRQRPENFNRYAYYSDFDLQQKSNADSSLIEWKGLYTSQDTQPFDHNLTAMIGPGFGGNARDKKK